MGKIATRAERRARLASLWLAPVVALIPAVAAAQSSGTLPTAALADTQSDAPTISTRSTLVVVPALVRDKSGELVFNLKPGDFALTDDGVPQRLRLDEDTGGEPLALVVMIEAGGDGVRELGQYGALPAMLDTVIGGVPHQVAVVAFDSSPELEQDFTPDTEKAAAIIPQLAAADAGDKGAAIVDALGFSIDLLRKQPAEYRRAVLMITETRDRGSQMELEDAVRAVSDTNTSIYAIAFSSTESDVKHEAGRFRFGGVGPNGDTSPGPAGGCFARNHKDDPDTSDNPLVQFWDCLSELAPPLRLAKMAALATEGMRQNVPETVARMTGGEYFKLGNQKKLERDLMTISNHIPNRYVFTFQPQSPHPGLHVLDLKLKDYPQLRITARTSYWANPEP